MLAKNASGCVVCGSYGDCGILGIMNENPKYTLQLKAVGDHLEVYIPELDITVETQPGETSYDAALNLAHDAVVEYHLKQREQEAAAKAS